MWVGAGSAGPLDPTVSTLDLYLRNMGNFLFSLSLFFFFPETSFNFFFQLFFTVVNAHNIKLLNDFQRTVQPH